VTTDTVTRTNIGAFDDYTTTTPTIPHPESPSPSTGTRYGLHIPTRYNPTPDMLIGVKIPESWFDTLHERLGWIADGWTVLPGRGYWRGSDRCYQEDVLLYEIDIPSRNPSEALLKLARDVRRELGQEGVYLTRIPVIAEVIA